MLLFYLTKFFIILCFCLINSSAKNNVCKNVIDYITIDTNPNCWHNPDVGNSVVEIISRWGFPVESYDIITEDGYINALYRIPHNNNTEIPRRLILLRGDLSCGPLCFLSMGNNSLAFYLANNGFDVWLSTRRGFIDNKGHRNYTRQNKEFWDFSFHESGYYDIWADVKFISRKTKMKQKIILLAYSIGSTETYVYASLRNKQAKKHVSGIISVGPLAFMTKSGGYLAKVAPFMSIMKEMLEKEKIYALNFTAAGEKKTFNFHELLFARSQIASLDPSQISAVDLPVYLGCKHTPLSIKLLQHFGQEVNADGRFQFFDYGPEKNVKLYNSSYPPEYNVSKIEIPVHLFYGENDSVSAKEDVLLLFNKLTVQNKSLVSISQDKTEFNHLDFLLAKDISKLFYEVLLKTIKDKLVR